jgi:hypothetical protein
MFPQINWNDNSSVRGTWLFKLLLINVKSISNISMEQHALKIVNDCLNTNIYSFLDTSGGQISDLHLNVGHFIYTSIT